MVFGMAMTLQALGMLDVLHIGFRAKYVARA
jgi:hypothetical protein